MAGYVRLQPLTTINAAQAQRVEGAVHLGDLGEVTAQVRIAVAGDAGSLMYLQHAAELEEQAFTDCAAVALDEVGSQVVLLQAPLRYLRWRAALVDLSTATFQIDLVGRGRAAAGRRLTATPWCFQLQDLRTIETDHSTGINFFQDLYEAVDVLPYRTLVVQVRRPYLSSTLGTNLLIVQHAADLAEDAFVTLGTGIDLNASPNEFAVFSRPLRYIRWRVVLSSPFPKTLRFQVDVIARET